MRRWRASWCHYLPKYIPTSSFHPKPLPHSPPQVVGIPGRQSSATQELVFLAASLNPLALTHFKLTKMGETQEEVEEPMEEEEFLLGREGGVQVMGSKASPLLRLVNSRTGVDIQVPLPVTLSPLFL